MKLKDSLEGKLFGQHIKKQRHYFVNKGPSNQGYGFSSSHVWMWELDYKESWAPKNWCFWSVVLEKTLENPLDCKEIQPVHPKWDQSWVFIGRTDVEAQTPILWPPDAKSWLIWKGPDDGKDSGQEEKGMAEDEMVGWHHRLNGQGGLECCGSWSRKESDTTEWLSWTELNFQSYLLLLKSEIMCKAIQPIWDCFWDFLVGGSSPYSIALLSFKWGHACEWFGL